MLAEVHPLTVCNTTPGFEFRVTVGSGEEAVEVELK